MIVNFKWQLLKRSSSAPDSSVPVPSKVHGLGRMHCVFHRIDLYLIYGQRQFTISRFLTTPGLLGLHTVLYNFKFESYGCPPPCRMMGDRSYGLMPTGICGECALPIQITTTIHHLPLGFEDLRLSYLPNRPWSNIPGGGQYVAALSEFGQPA